MGGWIGEPSRWQRLAHVYVGRHQPWPERRRRNRRAILVLGVTAFVAMLTVSLIGAIR